MPGVSATYEQETLLPNMRKLFPVYDNYTDKQLLDGMRKKYNAYFDIPDGRLARGFEKKFQPVIDEIYDEMYSDKPEERKWYNKPIADLPNWMGMKKPGEVTTQDLDKTFGEDGLNENIKRAMYGSIYGFYESLDELTTPLNLGLMTVTAGVYPLVKKGYHIARLGGSLASFIFAAQMGKELPKGWEQFGQLVREAGDDLVKWGEVGRLGAKMLFGTGMAFMAAKHGIGELRGEVGTMRTLKKLGEKPTKRITGEQLKELQLQHTSEMITDVVERELAIGRGKEFHYENINELQQRTKGLMELGKAKVELDKFGKKKTGIDQGEGFWEKEYQLGRQRKIITDKDKVAEFGQFQEELFKPPEQAPQRKIVDRIEKSKPFTNRRSINKSDKTTIEDSIEISDELDGIAELQQRQNIPKLKAIKKFEKEIDIIFRSGDRTINGYELARQNKIIESLNDLGENYKDWNDIPDYIKIYRGDVKGKKLKTGTEVFSFNRKVSETFGYVTDYLIHKNDIEWVGQTYLTFNDFEVFAKTNHVIKSNKVIKNEIKRYDFGSQQELFAPGEAKQPSVTNKLPTDPTLPLEQLPYQTELFRPFEIVSELAPKLTKKQIDYRNDILIEAGKKGLVDKFGRSSFEMIRLLDHFGVDKIDALNAQQMRQLKNMVSKLPNDYSKMIGQIDKYYNRINKSVFSPDIARQLVGNKDLNDVKIPYDDNYDYVYNPRKGSFDREKIRIADEDVYNSIIKKSREKFGDNSKTVLNELTDNQLKRLSSEDLKLLKNRLDKADPGYTVDELKDFLSSGEEVYSFSETTVGNRFDWLLSKYAQSAYTFFDKVGMGQVFRDAVQNKRLTDITMVNTYRKVIDEAFAPIKNSKYRMKKFAELALEYREKGMAAFSNHPTYRPIMEKIQSIFKEISDLSIEHDVEVFNPIAGKAEPFSMHVDPHYQPNMYSPKKIAKMRKTNRLADKIKQKTGYTDQRQIDNIVESILGNRKGYKQGNLENVRLVDEPGWLGDPRDLGWKPNDLINGYMVYLHGAVDRITSLKFFEGKGTGGSDLYNKHINKMSEVNRKIAMEYMNRIRRMNKKGYYDDWAVTIRNLQLMRKLNLAPIANSMQITITSLPKYSILGYRRMIIDLAKEAFPIIKTMRHNDLATLGIDMANSMESLVGLQGGNNLNGIARKWLKANLFSTTEFFNRNFSYHMGQRYVERMIRMLHGRDRMKGENWRNWARGSGRKYLIDELKKMGVSDRAIDTAVLTPEDLHRAGYRFSMETQFSSMPENLPFAWSTPWGKVATQFKSFTFSNARFVKDNIIRPILRNPSQMNSWKPLLTWVAASQIAGETASYIRQQALKHILGIERKKPRASDPMIRGLENMLAISPFGLGWELWQSLGYGDFWSNILGPTAGDINDITASIRKGELPIEEVMPYPLNKVVKKQIRE